MLELGLLCRLLLAGVLIVGGTAKLLDRQGTREAVVAFGLPDRWATFVAGSLAPVELLVACLLLLHPSRWGPGAALLLLALLTAAVAENLRRGRRPSCHCFGSLGGGAISGRTLLRNAALAALAGAALLAPPVSLSTFLRSSGTAVLLLMLLVAVAGVGAFVVFEARAGRRRERDQLSAGTEQFVADLEHGADRGPAPGFSLPALTGVPVTLPDLLTDGRPLLLTFLSPGCGPCKRLRPYVARWNEVFAGRVRVAAVVSGTRASNLGSFGGSGFPVLLDEDRTVATAYAVAHRPTAVIVTPHGRLLGPPASGDLNVRRLVDALLSGHLAPQPEVPATALTLASSPGPRATVTARREEALVVTDEVTGASVTLDALGAIVWQCLDGRSPLREIARDIAEVFGAPRDRVGSDVLGLVMSLGDLGLLHGVAADNGSHDQTPQARRAANENALVRSA